MSFSNSPRTAKKCSSGGGVGGVGGWEGGHQNLPLENLRGVSLEIQNAGRWDTTNVDSLCTVCTVQFTVVLRSKQSNTGKLCMQL